MDWCVGFGFELLVGELLTTNLSNHQLAEADPGLEEVNLLRFPGLQGALAEYAAGASGPKSLARAVIAALFDAEFRGSKRWEVNAACATEAPDREEPMDVGRVEATLLWGGVVGNHIKPPHVFGSHCFDTYSWRTWPS